MPVFELNPTRIEFPDPKYTDESGILAVGGDLQAERLLLAYEMGLFPWFNEDEPPLWWCPDPRMVLYPNELRISKSMRSLLRKNTFRVTADQNFEEVIRQCGAVPRPGQDGTWITEDIINGYLELYRMGFAHSVEVWSNNALTGGLYGVSLGKTFFGESMFSLAPNASKVGFITLVEALKENDFQLIDCQVHTAHLESLGAQEISRTSFLSQLRKSLVTETIRGSWSFLFQ